MSFDSMDAQREAYEDELYERISDEAVENFTAKRLKSFYEGEPLIAEKAFKSLEEAKQLALTRHCTAAFIHAAITSEVMLKGVILRPIVHGFVHSDSIAPFIVDLALCASAFNRKEVKEVFAKIFRDVGSLDLATHSRKGGSKPLWNEILEVQKRRDRIMHRAELATEDETRHALDVAIAVTEELFPALAKSLGYHLHDGYRLCAKCECSLPPEIQKLLKQVEGEGAN